MAPPEEKEEGGGEEPTSSTMKVPMRPIMQALEFQTSAVVVKPQKASVSFGSTLGIST